MIDGDVTGDGAALAAALRRLASKVEAYTNAELEDASFDMNGPGVSVSTVELRATGDDE